MWFFNRDKYQNAKDVRLTSLSLNPDTDLTIDRILMYDVPPTEPVHRKVFRSREKRNNELAVVAHRNLWGFILDGEDYQPNGFFDFGFDPKEKEWYADMLDYGTNDFERIKYADREEADEIITKCVKDLARMQAVEPVHLLDKRALRKNGDVKKRTNVGKLIETLTEEGVSFNKKDLWKGVNSLDSLLGVSFDYDSWLGNFIDGRKIDEDKSGFVNGFYNAAFLIEGTDSLSPEQVQEKKMLFLDEMNKYIGKKNAVVRARRAHAQETMLWLVDTFLPADMKVVQKVRRQILKNPGKTIEQYMGMLNRRGLRGNIYAIDSFVSNLQEGEYVSAEAFEVMYQSGKLVRSLGMFSNYDTFMKNSEVGSDDEVFYAINKQDQLEKAIEAANWILDSDTVGKYTPDVSAMKDSLTRLRDTLESVRDQLYMPKAAEALAPVVPLAVAKPAAKPLEYLLNAA